MPLYAEAFGVVLAAACRSSLRRSASIGLLFLLWLLMAGRRRADQKYAGLRILR